MCKKIKYGEIKTTDSLAGEQWRDIEGFEGLYCISSLGRVRSCQRIDWQNRVVKEKILSQNDNGNGYLTVQLSKQGRSVRRYVHRLVAIAFIPNEENKPEVNHINEFEKWNNTVENLEWIDHIANVNYGTHNQRISKSNGGKANESSCKPVIKLSVNGEYLERYVSAADASRKNGLSIGCVQQCCKIDSHRYTAGGFLWCYENNYSPDMVNKIVIKYQNRYKNQKKRILSQSEKDRRSKMCRARVMGLGTGAKKICERNKAGDIIRVFSCAKLASLYTGTLYNSVLYCAQGRLKTGDAQRWVYYVNLSEEDKLYVNEHLTIISEVAVEDEFRQVD